MATYTAHPDYVVPTGDFIEEWMEEEGINTAELARRLDVSRKHVSELLRGKAPLSHDMALRLENTTGVPARIWNLHETGYQAALARQAADAKLIAQHDRAKEFPLGYLRKHSFITAPARDKAGTVRGCSSSSASPRSTPSKPRGSRVPLRIAGPPSGATTPIIWPPGSGRPSGATS